MAATSTHDPELIRQYGDDIEKLCADRILQTLPSYALFWATFVGNDGHERPLPMPRRKKEDHEARDSFWSYLYTIFESVVLCWAAEDQLKRQQEITTFTDYTSTLNAWTAFYAHLGRIHDMVDKACADLNDLTLAKPFKDFYSQRNIALHDIKTPMRWVENLLAAPRLGEGDRSWRAKMKWSELKLAEFELLAEHVAATLREIEPLLERFFVQAFKEADRIRLTPVQWPSADTRQEQPIKTIPFARTQSYQINGISGVRDF